MRIDLWTGPASTEPDNEFPRIGIDCLARPRVVRGPVEHRSGAPLAARDGAPRECPVRLFPGSADLPSCGPRGVRLLCGPRLPIGPGPLRREFFQFGLLPDLPILRLGQGGRATSIAHCIRRVDGCPAVAATRWPRAGRRDSLRRPRPAGRLVFFGPGYSVSGVVFSRFRRHKYRCTCAGRVLRRVGQSLSVPGAALSRMHEPERSCAGGKLAPIHFRCPNLCDGRTARRCGVPAVAQPRTTSFRTYTQEYRSFQRCILENARV